MKRIFILFVPFIIASISDQSVLAETPDSNQSVKSQVVIKGESGKAEKSNQLVNIELIQPDKLKEDLDFLFKTIEEVHPNMFAYTTKQEFEPLKKQSYEKTCKPMSPFDFYKATAPVVASLKNSHTYLLPNLEDIKNYIKTGGKVFPLALSWDGSNVYIAKNYSSVEILLGAKILKINGEPANQIVESFNKCSASEGKYPNNEVLGSPLTIRQKTCIVLFYSYFGPMKEWEFDIEKNNGKVCNCNVESVDYLQLKKKQKAIFDDYHYKYKLGYNTGIITLNSMCDFTNPEKSGNFEEFLRETFQNIKDARVSHLIIDIRENPGGDSRAGDKLLEYLTGKPFRQSENVQTKISCYIFGNEQNPSRLPAKYRNKKIGSIVQFEGPFIKPKENPLRFNGKVFVLTGHDTCSAAMSFSAAIKCFKIGIIIGEETGDPTVGYGDSLRFTLPNSKLTLSVACRYFSEACGKPDGRGVIPDYEVKQKPENTAKGIDTVLQFTLDLIEKAN